MSLLWECSECGLHGAILQMHSQRDDAVLGTCVFYVILCVPVLRGVGAKPHG